ncbi:MAG: hypothetical protein ACRCVA_22105, partial [Phreatobacter sp.]
MVANKAMNAPKSARESSPRAMPPIARMAPPAAIGGVEVRGTLGVVDGLIEVLISTARRQASECLNVRLVSTQRLPEVVLG